MADVITRFKLETTQYDSALRDSTKGLKEVIRVTELAGKDFKEFSDKAIESARALGQQATGATNAKDKVKELVSSYNEMAKAYNDMSNAMKQSEGGKALAASLEQLQDRIREAKSEMNEAPGILDKLKSKFVVSFDAVKMFNVGLQAAEGALKVAKDAFFASESTVDEWGRVMASAQSVYDGFLTAINTGDISGYLNRIDEIVAAARKAYDELDRLGTMKTIQAPGMSKQEAENTRMRTMLMTGRYIAPAPGSGMKAAMADGTLLTPTQLKNLEQKLQNGMNTIVKMTGNELEQTGKAIDAYYDKLAKQNGMTKTEFKKGVSSMSEFDKRIEGARRYSEYERAHTTYDERSGISHRDKTVNPYEQYRAWSVFRVDKQGQNSYNDLVGLIRQQQQQTSQMYSTMGQAYRTINRAEGITVKNTMSGNPTSSGNGSHKLTDPEKADQKYDQAQRDYQQALEQAALELKAGTITQAEAKRKEYQAQESLWKSIGDAREIYDSPKLKNAQDEAAKKIVELGGNVNELKAAEDAAKQTAREQAAAQKKLATAQEEAAEAIKDNDLKGLYAANKKIVAAGGQPIAARASDATERIQDQKEMNAELGFSYTSSNLDAFIASLKEKLSNADMGSELAKSLNSQLADTNALGNIMQVAIKNGIDVSQFNPQDLWKKVFGDKPGDFIEDSTWQSIEDTVNARLKELGIKPIKINVETGALEDSNKVAGETQKQFSAAAGAIRSVGSALSQIEDPAAKVMGIVAQAIATVAAAAAQAIAAQDTTASGWAWIGAAAAITAEMATIISQIHSATGYAQGGVIPGNSYSGDAQWARVNAGETILTRAQAGNLVSQLEGGGLGNLRLSATISGEQIRLALNNNGRRTGRGEYVTTNFVRS